MVEKIISVITLIPRSGRFYARQVQELFGDRVRVYAYSTGDQSVKKNQALGSLPGVYGRL